MEDVAQELIEESHEVPEVKEASNKEREELDESQFLEVKGCYSFGGSRSSDFDCCRGFCCRSLSQGLTCVF